ncbi:MAG: MerR family transcriptional regulator [Bacteroidetes bacterium]|nr:MerR family transcriptional regulator [Bacteroidota bacterium]
MAELQQLDLFGFPVETAAPKPKKEKAEKPATKEPITAKADDIVFADETIGIRIKQKPVLEKLPVAKKPAAMVSDSKSVVIGKRGRKSFKEMDNEVDLIDVPDESILKQKLYYSISEVAGWFKVNTSLLRYWENEFDVLQPRKTRKGDRLFRVEDIKNLQLIYFLLRQRKFSIEGAKKYIKNNKTQADIQAQLIQSLTKFKSFLLELKSNVSVSH